jgi:molecular chaperone DnaJ
VPAGIENGEMIRLTGRGEAVQNGAPGDLYVKIHVTPHKYITRDGLNLRMDLSVKLTDALLGASYNIETLDGSVSIKIPEGIKNGEVLRIRQKGVKNGSNRGDFLVRVLITIPQKLSRHARKLVEELRNEGI